MKIGVDIDDTITYTSEYVNKMLSEELTRHNVSDYHELNKAWIDKFLKKNLDTIHANVKIREGVKEFFDDALNMGYEIIIITARKEDDITKKLLKDNGLFPTKVYYEQKLKDNICVMEHLDYFIDDKDMILDRVKNRGIKTIMMSNGLINNNHICVNSWEEIRKIIL